MQTNAVLTDHMLALALAEQRAAHVRRRYVTHILRLRAAVAGEPERIRPLLEALGGQPRAARRAAALLGALGAAGGAALAALLPQAFAEVEGGPPQGAAELRLGDAMLCAAIGIIEQLAPEQLARVQRSIGEGGTWWTFRARLRLRGAVARLGAEAQRRGAGQG